MGNTNSSSCGDDIFVPVDKDVESVSTDLYTWDEVIINDGKSSDTQYDTNTP